MPCQRPQPLPSARKCAAEVGVPAPQRDHDFAIAKKLRPGSATRRRFRCSEPRCRRTGMYEPRSFAYSLSQVETGWQWSVYDEDGETVARGADASRDAA